MVFLSSFRVKHLKLFTIIMEITCDNILNYFSVMIDMSYLLIWELHGGHLKCICYIRLIVYMFLFAVGTESHSLL